MQPPFESLPPLAACKESGMIQKEYRGRSSANEDDDDDDHDNNDDDDGSQLVSKLARHTGTKMIATVTMNHADDDGDNGDALHPRVQVVLHTGFRLFARVRSIHRVNAAVCSLR